MTTAQPTICRDVVDYPRLVEIARETRGEIVECSEFTNVFPNRFSDPGERGTMMMGLRRVQLLAQGWRGQQLLGVIIGAVTRVAAPAPRRYRRQRPRP